MFKWDVKKMLLMKEYADKRMDKYKWQRFGAEDISREEKIAFIDSQTGGYMTAVLNLYEKFVAEEDKLKHDSWGYVKKVSLKAWMNRNAKGTPVHYGEEGQIYKLFGMERRITTLNQKQRYDTYEDVVDEVFRRLLMDCRRQEEAYFKEHDEYSILVEKVSHSPYLPLLNIGDGNNDISIWTGSMGIGLGDKNGISRKLTIEELRFLSDACDELEKRVKEYSMEINPQFVKMVNDSD